MAKDKLTDVPGIGERLQDHPAFTIALRMRDAAIDPATPTISVVATHAHHQVLALDHLPDAPGLGALTVGLLDVMSEGHIRLGADGEPVVELRQLTDATDRARLVAGVVDTVRRLDHPAWASVFDEVFLDVSDHLEPWGSATAVAREIRRRVRAALDKVGLLKKCR